MTPEKLIGKIEKRMEKVNTYQVKMEMEIISPESPQVYHLEQWYQSPDLYRLEMTGGEARQVIIASGQDTYLYHPELKDYYKIKSPYQGESRDSIFLSGFWFNLTQSRELNITGEEVQQNNNFYILEVVPKEQTSQWHREKIWLEKNKLVPFTIEVYDDQDCLRTVFRYKEIILNEEIEPELFETDFSWEEASAECQALSLTLTEAEDAVEFPLRMPFYLPPAVELSLITIAEEPDYRAVIFHYQGQQPFTLVQQGLRIEGEPAATGSEAGSEDAVGAERVPLGEGDGFIREDEGITTLFWYTGGKKYIITGELHLDQMVKVASSLWY